MNKKSSKLLAAFTVLVMVMCAFAAVSPSADGAVTISETGADTLAAGTPVGVTSSGSAYVFEGVDATKPIKFSGETEIQIKGTNSITIDVTDKTGKNAALFGNAVGDNITIKGLAGSNPVLNITVTGTPAGDGYEDTYGIVTPGKITIQDVEINVQVSKDWKNAIAIRGDSEIEFNNVTGSVDGGNRAVHIEKANGTIAFVGSTNLTVSGGEKAIQAKTGSITLSDSAIVNAVIVHRDGITNNGGDNDEYAVKVKNLSIGANTTLNADGVHITGTGSNIIGTLTLNPVDRGSGANPNFTSELQIDASCEMTVSGYLSVPNGTVVVNEGTIITTQDTGIFENNGTFINKGSITNNGTFTNNGVMNNYQPATSITGTINNYGTLTSTSVISDKVEGTVTQGFGIGASIEAVEGDLIISGYAFLQSNITIAEDKDMILRNGAILDLRGYTLTLNGKLIVEAGAQVLASSNPDLSTNANAIALGTGSIDNSGVVGAGTLGVTIRAADAYNTNKYSSVTVLNVDGLSFSILTIGEDDAAKDYLALAGIVTANPDYSTNRIVVDKVYVSDDLEIGADVEMAIGVNSLTVTEGGILTNDGVVSSNDVSATMTLEAGATVVVNGTFSAPITAKTGDVETEKISTDLKDTTVTASGISGLTVTVMSEEYKSDAATPVGMTEISMNIYGEITLLDADGTGSITVSGEDGSIVTVPADSILNIPAKVTVAISGTDFDGITVDGTVQYVTGATVSGFLGAQYQAGTATPYTYYIKSFDAAIKDIATANPKTVTILPNTVVTLTQGFTLNSGEIIVNEGTFIVENGAEVLFASGSKFTGAIAEVQGLLKVEKGTANVTKYAVLNNGTDGSKTYAGFLPALAASVAGDKITVVGVGYDTANPLTIAEDVVIPADRTVTVNCNMVFEKNLTVEESATVKVTKPIVVNTEKKVLDVKGTMEFTGDGSLSAKTVNVTGLLKIAGNKLVNGANTIINAAYYTKNNVNYYSTLAKTVNTEGVTEVTVVGTINETGEITLDGIKLNINNGWRAADVTIGKIVLIDSTITIAGTTNVKDGEPNSGYAHTLTAEIVGAYGEMDATTDASMKVVSVTDVVIKNGDNAAGEKENTISAFNGKMYTIVSGEFATPAKSVGIDTTLVIDSAATLIVTGTFALDNSTTVNGTLEAAGTVNVAAETEADVPGSIVIPEEGKVVVTGTLNLTGTIIVEDVETGTDGVLDVNGRLNLGSAPTTLGATPSIDGVVDLKDATGYVVVYSGDTTKMKFDPETVEGSDLVINGTVYATIYGTPTLDTFSEEISKLRDLDVPTTTDTTTYPSGLVIEWYDGEDLVDLSTKMEGGTTYTSKIALQSVNVVFSIGTGISLTVDGILINSYYAPSEELDIGKHTVSATFEPGYTGTINLVFNGKAVTDGTIEITTDMVGQNIILSATGEVAVDTGKTGSSGMSLTEILLIVLVVLIAIMAIVIAMRMMRS